MSENTWLVWSKYVLKELERLDKADKDAAESRGETNEKVTNLRIKLAVLAFGISATTGIVSSVATSLIVWLITK